MSKAIKKKIEKEPKCTFCPNPATTAHHFIHQARSNYLRLEEKNLIPICEVCHYKLHNGYEQIYALQARSIFGDKWADELIADSRKTITDNMAYWRKKFEEL